MICKFFLNPKNRWTQDKYVVEYEDQWKKYTEAKYALMVSSGSTANTLIAQYAKYSNPNKNEIVFPAVTWQTSVSPWIHQGFKPKFIDVNLKNFSIDIDGAYAWTGSGGALANGVDDVLETNVLNLRQAVSFIFGNTVGASDVSYTGSGFITSVSITGGTEDTATYSLSIEGTGELTQVI